MKIKSSSIWHLWPFYLFFLILTLFFQDKSFFWDKDLIISRQAHWFLETGFDFKYPVYLDVGYPPLLATAVAVLWLIFGKSLAVGHWLMFAGTLLAIHQTYRFSRYLFPKNFLPVYVSLAIIWLDTTLMAQTIQVSTDLFQILFFFWALNCIVYDKRRFLWLALTLLALIHSRGVVAVMALFLVDVVYAPEKKQFNPLSSWFKAAMGRIVQYLPSAVVTIAFLIFHYQYAGWIGYHEDSPWAGCYEPVGLAGIFRNAGILVWRIIDFGRIFLWLAFIIAWWFGHKSNYFKDRQFLFTGFISLLFLMINLPVMLPYANLSDHRYLITFFMLFSLLLVYLLFNFVESKKIRNLLLALCFTGLFSGHFWVYPDHIAQGWSGTMAHWPFYGLRQDMLAYIEENNIPFEAVGTKTPNATAHKHIFLNDEERKFPMADLDKQDYIFYSNIINDFTDEEIGRLYNQWDVQKKYERMGVKVILFKKREL